MNRLSTQRLVTGYGSRRIVHELSTSIPDGELTVIVGPNACGKSTLLRALSRLLAPTSGQVLLDGGDIRRLPTKEVARRMALLPQTPLAPEGISVAALVSRGRYPHQSVFTSWSDADERAVESAMEATAITDLADRMVDELSGGQRQRVWIAMALAQETPILLLDEPTTFLDIGHQVEVLELVSHLRDEGRTVVAVLHDINQAARYATHIIAMQEGRIVAEGAPADVISANLLEELFALPARIIEDPLTGSPVVLPGR